MRFTLVIFIFLASQTCSSQSFKCETEEQVKEAVFASGRAKSLYPNLRTDFDCFHSISTDSLRYSIRFHEVDENGNQIGCSGGPTVIVNRSDCKIIKFFHGGYTVQRERFWELFDPDYEPDIQAIEEEIRLAEAEYVRNHPKIGVDSIDMKLVLATTEYLLKKGMLEISDTISVYTKKLAVASPRLSVTKKGVPMAVCGWEDWLERKWKLGSFLISNYDFEDRNGGRLSIYIEAGGGTKYDGSVGFKLSDGEYMIVKSSLVKSNE